MKCRSCGGASFGDVIDLGDMPLVNNLLPQAEAPCPRWPLKVVFCRACSLAQLTASPPPAEMFDEYLYFSSQSHTMLAHAESLTKRFVQPGDRVIEIASNDGYLLERAKERGATVLGIDPARNIAHYANARGIPTRAEYFNYESSQRILKVWGSADLVFANNVLAHVPDPNELAAGIKSILASLGTAHIEVPSVVCMIQSTAFDTIYHEHQCYFSLSALKSLFNRHGLAVTDATIIDIHGGSFHLQLKHSGDETIALRMIESEQSFGILKDNFYSAFAANVQKLKHDLEQAMQPFDTVAGYGAAAKGIVLLNTFGLTADRIPWVADVSPHKQGKYIPGTRQPVVSPDWLIDHHPDAALLLPWNIKQEVIRRNAAFLNQGGQFIVPIPRVQVVGSANACHALAGK